MHLRTNFSRSVLLAVGVHALVSTRPSLAWAQTPHPAAPSTSSPAASAAGDAIYLKSGGLLRGTLIDAIPGDRARISLATGEIATVSWADISRIQHADGSQQTLDATSAGPPSASPPPKPAAAPAPASVLSASQSMVWVHLEGSEGASLEQDTTGNDDWAIVCTEPCDRQVSTAYWYRIGGGGIKASSQFALHGQPGAHETLTVSGASKGWFIAGVAAVPVGGLVAYIGLLVGVFGSLASSVSNSSLGPSGASTSNNGQTVSSGVAATGWTMLAVGGIAMVAGAVVAIANWKSGVSQDVSGEKAAQLPDAWRPLAGPTWREASPEQRALPAVNGVRVLSGAF